SPSSSRKSTAKTYSKVVFLLATLLLQRCTFNPNGEDSEPDLSKEIDLDAFRVSLNDEDETIVVYKNTTFEYVFAVDFLEELGDGQVRLMIDDRILNQYEFCLDQSPDTLRIDLDILTISDGTYELRIEQSTPFRGSTVASEFGITFETFGAWQLIVDRTPEPVAISNFNVEDGELWIEWEEPEMLNFDEYGINARVNGQSQLVLFPKDQARVKYPYFLEGIAEFQISKLTDKTSNSIGPVARYELHEELIRISSRDSSIYATITRPTLYKHVQSIQTDYFTYGEIDFEQRDFLLEESLLLGKKIDFFYSFSLGNEDAPPLLTSTGQWSGFRSLVLGTSIPAYDRIIHSEANDCYYARIVDFIRDGSNDFNEGTYIFKIDASSFEVTDTLLIPVRDSQFASIAISPNGSLLTVGINATNSVYQLDPMTLDVMEIYDLQNDFGYVPDNTIEREPAVLTDDGLLLLRRSSFYVLDIVNHREFFRAPTREGGIIGQFGDMSPNGEYLFYGGKLYQNNSNSFEELLTVDLTHKVGWFINDDKLLHFNETEADILEIPSLTKIGSFIFDGIEDATEFGSIEGRYHLDRDLRRFLSSETGNTIQVFDFSGNLLAEYPIEEDASYDYLNGYFFSNVGQAVKTEIP
ncbi:MAG: hypothetical protein AAFO69_14810, partial [Bacteroidota bacterium]